ncbi:MAG TPA: hypothetical protein VHK67_03075 [Rhabdochlamydiaceae bacterium]|jgi:hypothetical protein|nr:hypothetical protein [Rhabdochlamydiaceae bacterium]
MKTPSNTAGSSVPVGLAIIAFDHQAAGRQVSQKLVTRELMSHRRQFLAPVSSSNQVSIRGLPLLEQQKIQALPRLELMEEPSPADEKSAQTATAQPKKSLWQTITQPKVLRVAGIILGVTAMAGLGGAAAAAAYHYYPVATVAQATAVANAGRIVALNTHQLLILPGVENVLFYAMMAINTAIIPAAKVALPVFLPAVSTAVVSTLTTLVILYAANRVWQAAKNVVWAATSAVANAFGKELDKTYPGMAVKAIVATAAAPIVEMFDENSFEMIGDDKEQRDEEVAVLPSSIRGSDASEPAVEVTTEQENASVEKTRQKKKKRAKPQRSLANRIASYALLALAVGGGAYLYSRGNAGLNQNVGLNQ